MVLGAQGEPFNLNTCTNLVLTLYALYLLLFAGLKFPAVLEVWLTPTSRNTSSQNNLFKTEPSNLTTWKSIGLACDPGVQVFSCQRKHIL